MRYTSIDSEVNVIIDGKTQQGKIVEVISQGAALIELGDKSHIQTTYSPTGEDCTFHYPDETEAIKKANAAPKPQPAAAAPAPSSNK
jgi:hypothetical protein